MNSSPPEEGRLSPGLYIVATPIGNLSDLSPRAADILSRADAIAVEDSRVTAKLLAHIGARRHMVPYHDHNADRVRPGLVARLGSEAIALVSDAGTPLISDPGFKLVRDARGAGHAVVTIPGPCAAIAALTLAGLPTDRFFFLGFLPAKAKARADAIAEIAGVRATLILYESGPRLSATLAALAEGLGDREAAVAREISKKFEECLTDIMALCRNCSLGRGWHMLTGRRDGLQNIQNGPHPNPLPLDASDGRGRIVGGFAGYPGRSL